MKKGESVRVICQRCGNIIREIVCDKAGRSVVLRRQIGRVANIGGHPSIECRCGTWTKVRRDMI
jgi:hypothetical protein